MCVKQPTTETRQRTSRHHVTDAPCIETSRRSFPSLKKLISLNTRNVQQDLILIISEFFASTIFCEETKISLDVGCDDVVSSCGTRHQNDDLAITIKNVLPLRYV